MSRRLLRALAAGGVGVALIAALPAAALAVADTTPPDPPIVTGPSGKVASTTADISVTPADPSDTVVCLVDLEEVVCPGSWTITGLTEGPHTVSATSYDAANNASTEVYVLWTVDTTGPAASVIAPTSLTTKAAVSFNENATGISAQSIRLVTDAGTIVPASRSCVTNTLETTPCDGSLVRKVYLVPDTGWVLGERYRILVNPSGSVTVADALGNKAAAVDTAFRVSTAVEETWPTFTWRSVAQSKAYGGSYVSEARAGASATWAFTGGRLTWITVIGPGQGKAEVYVDGALRGTYNNYGDRVRFGVERTLTGLGAGGHTVEVRPLGKKGARTGTGTMVAIDGFITADGTDGSPQLTAERWQRVLNSGASNGYYAVAELAGQTASTEFRGTSVTLHTAVGPRFGEVALLVDGEPAATDDLYAPTLAFGHLVTVSGLSDTRHTLTVRVLGTRSAASAGTAVAVDRITVG